MSNPGGERDALKRDIARECQSDYVGIWLIVAFLREQFPIWDQNLRRLETLQIIGELLSDSEDLLVGETTREGGFRAWDVSPAEAVERIAGAWPPDGNEPDIGDIAWLTSRTHVASLIRQ